jgi:hypothetical protein
MSDPETRLSFQTWIVVAMIVLTILFCVGAGLYVMKGKTLSRELELLWAVVFAFLVTWWSRADHEKRPSQSAQVPAFLMFALWPLILPFQLIGSRKADGAVLYIGFLGLGAAPFFTELLMWYSY